MTRAQCYYDILGVEQTASSDDIKKAYRNLALVWHPDKNQSNPEEAHAKFQGILKAYETLSDSRERDWYDRHKDQILSGGDDDESEKCLNLFQYFSSSCYSNFDDSDDGFYTIYREVFKTIAEEEKQARAQSCIRSKNNRHDKKSSQDEEYHTFGKSDSDYEEVVRPFYAFWSSFCTCMTFDHLDKYNTTEAENRRILRAMEKENKKIKEQARKERNTNVRNLVEFIKKRDKRLKLHKQLVEQQNEINRQKTAEKQRQQREKSLKETSEYKPTGWADMSDFEEQLQQLENEYDCQDYGKRTKGNRETQSKNPTKTNTSGDDEEAEGDIGDEQIEEEENEDEEEVDFFCAACNKQFRTINAFENHEASKKHKQNVNKLMNSLKEDEKKLNK